MSAAPVADHRPLSERWRPSRLRDLVGNERAREELASWAAGWTGTAPPARRAALLVGPPGVGKTTAAVALASDRGWALVEMNASDARNQSAIERVAGRASITRALDAPVSAGRAARTLILLDEADCLTGGRTTEGSRPAREPVGLRTFLEGRYGSVGALNAAWGLTEGGRPRPFADWTAVPSSPGNAAWARLPAARRDLVDWKDAGRTEETGDRGGLGAIARLVRSTRQPLVLTVNDDRPLHRYSPVFRSSVRSIHFGPVAPRELAERLRFIAHSERIDLGPDLIDTIVRRSGGDVRAALNDLEAIAPLTSPAVQRELLVGRDRASDFAELTEELLSRPRYYRSVEVRDRLDSPPDDLLPWVEENVPWFAPDAAHRDAALAAVAAAELLLARARRWRTYGLWSYATEILTGGVSLAVRDQPAPGVGQAVFPRFLGAMGFSRSARAVRESLVRKLASRLHLSRQKSRAIALPFVEAIFDRLARAPRSADTTALVRAIVAELDLSAEEVAALVNAPPDSRRVRELLPPGSEPAEGSSEGPSPPSSRGRSGVQRSLGEWGRG